MIGFWNLAREDESQVALVEWSSGRSLTRGELAARTNQVSHMFASRGIKPQDVVAVVLENRIEFFEVFLAAMQSGLYFVPINYHFTVDEIAHILGDSDAKAVFTSPKYADTVREAADIAGMPADVRFVTGEHPGFVSFETALAEHSADQPEERSEGLMMTYTSGTSGRPKGIKRPWSGRNPDEVGELWSHPMRIFGVEGNDHVHLVQSPLYHTAVLAYGNASAQYGHKIVLMRDWSATEALEAIAEHGVTTTHMVPTHFHRLLKIETADRAKYDVSSLQYVVHGAAPCPVDTKHAIIEWFGPVVYEYYGASEGGGTTVTSEEWLKYPGTVGRPWSWTEVRILNEEGEEVPTGEQGLVWMPTGSFDFEYHKSPEKTAQTKRAGFFTVGDVGHVNEDGYLFLHGRASDIIITGGVNIHPSEIEAAVLQHPLVADAAVFGVPDPEWGEKIQCVVQRVASAPTGQPSEDDIKEFCRGKVANYKIPASVDFVDQLPRDPNGKLFKRLLLDRYVNKDQ